MSIFKTLVLFSPRRKVGTSKEREFFRFRLPVERQTMNRIGLSLGGAGPHLLVLVLVAQ